MTTTREKLRGLMGQTNQALAGSLALPCEVQRMFLVAEGRMLATIFQAEGADGEIICYCPTTFASVQGIAQAISTAFLMYSDPEAMADLDAEAEPFYAWAAADTDAEDDDGLDGAPAGATLQ